MVWANVMSERNFWPVQRSVLQLSAQMERCGRAAHFIKTSSWLADGDANPTEFYYKLALEI